MTVLDLWNWVASNRARIDLCLSWESIMRSHPATNGRTLARQRQVELLLTRVAEEIRAIESDGEDGPGSVKWDLLWRLGDPSLAHTITGQIEVWCREQDPDLPVRRLFGAVEVVLEFVQCELVEAIGRCSTSGGGAS